ncbi:MAG TPA: transposase [Candidatus Binatia bacterium]|nr:transposase [Candidatus Binatia bacterium]
MIPLAEVLRRHWPAYERKYRARLLPSHRRAVAAILSCRTPALGGQLFRCQCGKEHYAYHSCNHRACPQCGHADATEWLNRQRRKLLPVPYYLVTFTVPEQLRRVIRSNQKTLYPLLLRESAAALRDVARDHKDLGAQIGLLAVLQTWTRDLRYHPHVHCVVPAGGLSPDRLRWVSPKCDGYFLPQAALAMRLRTRLKEALHQNHPQLFRQIPGAAWSLNWVADVQPVGTGEPALKYLAAYVYRTAFSAERILADDGQFITFTYRDSKDRSTRTVRLAAQDFLHRFLQHVLPQGLQRVRYFGFLSAAAKTQWQRVLALLDWQPPPIIPPAPFPVPTCPSCKKPMRLIGLLPRAPP